MDVEFDGFDWDRANRDHAAKHGVSPQETEQAVLDGLRVVAIYERNGETRYTGVAKTAAGGLIDITFTLRAGRFRPISVHKVKRTKRKRYEKEFEESAEASAATRKYRAESKSAKIRQR